jgi:hypothetical protein
METFMAASRSPEFSLLAACCMWPASERRKSAICSAATDSIHWDRFLRLAIRHQVVGLAHEGLTAADIEVPPPVAQEIKKLAGQLSLQSLALSAEAARLQEAFGKAHVPILSVKGPSLAMLAYGNLALRESKDLDVLVPGSFLNQAAELMEHAGYRRVDPPSWLSDAQMAILLSVRKDFDYVNDSKGIHVELHWRLLSNPHLMNESTALSSARNVPLSGDIGLQTLGREDLFTYLCGHGAVHWWYQLKWLADVGALLAKESDDGVEQLYRAAEQRGSGRAAGQAILLCHRLLAADVPQRLLRELRQKPMLRRLEATALNALTSEIRPADKLFGTTRGSLSCFLLGHSLRYSLAELKIHLICQADVMTLPLPKPLQFLYPVLRLPLWLWRQMTKLSMGSQRRIRPAR